MESGGGDFGYGACAAAGGVSDLRWFDGGGIFEDGFGGG